jgi:hypothetical protein
MEAKNIIEISRNRSARIIGGINGLQVVGSDVGFPRKEKILN